MLFITAY